MYPLSQVVKLLPPVVNEFVNDEYLLPIDSSDLQLLHQRRNVSDFVIHGLLVALQSTRGAQCARPRQRRPNAECVTKKTLSR